jgi:hypothetical protein
MTISARACASGRYKCSRKAAREVARLTRDCGGQERDAGEAETMAVQECPNGNGKCGQDRGNEYKGSEIECRRRARGEKDRH